MFAVKCMVITFTLLSFIKIIPIDSRYMKYEYDFIRKIMCTGLVVLTVGMVQLSVEDFLLYPLMIASVVISVFGWATCAVDRVIDKRPPDPIPPPPRV